MPTTVKQRLELLAKMEGLENVSELARHVQIREGTMRQHIARDSIPVKKARQYLSNCTKVEATTEWLMEGTGKPPSLRIVSESSPRVQESSLLPPESHSKMTNRLDDYTKVTGELGSGRAILPGMSNDFPVYGVADLGGATVSLSAVPDYLTDRPEWSKSASDFSFHVLTDVMGPHPDRGDRIEIMTTIPPKKGDLVVLLSGVRPDNWKAAVRRLVEIHDDHWVAEQLNPPETKNYPRSEWPKAYKVKAIIKA